MTVYECSECGGTAVERDYDVMTVEVQCPREECEEFCPHVNLDHPRVRGLLDAKDLERSARAVVAAVRGRL